MNRRALGLGVCLAVAALAAAPGGAAAKAPRIKVLSNRADLVSGGDALVRVKLPAGAQASQLQLTAGGTDVTGALTQTGKRRLEGLVEGLRDGRNALVARVAGGTAARLVVTNHPIGGPTFAGPQIQPWKCQDGAQDAQCNEPPSFKLLYLPKGAPQAGAALPGTNDNESGGSFRPYDPDAPPPDDQIETTTTTEGVTVPFIVRGIL